MKLIIPAFLIVMISCSSTVYKPADAGAYPQCAADPWASNTPVQTQTTALFLGKNFLSAHNASRAGYAIEIPHETDESQGGSSLKLHSLINARTQQGIQPEGRRDLVASAKGLFGDTPPPNQYDLRSVYPNCKSISAIDNQGQCGSCWAHATATSLADNLCVQYSIAHSGSNPPSDLANLALSSQFFMDCGIAHQQNFSESQLFGCQGGVVAVAYDFAKTNGIPTKTCRPGLFETSSLGALSCAGTCGCLRCGCQTSSSTAVESNDRFALFSNDNNYVFAATQNPDPTGSQKCASAETKPCTYCEQRCEYLSVPYKSYQVSQVYGLTNETGDAANALMQKAIMQYGSITIAINVPLSLMFYSSGIYRYTGWIFYSTTGGVGPNNRQSCNVSTDCQYAPGQPDALTNAISEFHLSYGCIDPTTNKPYTGTSNAGQCALSDVIEGGHALRVVGWDTTSTPGYWIIANTWGNSWGENGFFRLSMDSLTAQTVMRYSGVTWAAMNLNTL